MFRSLRTDHCADATVDCREDPTRSLVQMFVEMVQGGRIERGQCPALRPVFLKPHGVVHGTFLVRRDLPPDLRVGLFARSTYPVWLRFSSDTQPTMGDFKSTLGVALKLFDTPTPKIFGRPDDTTFDLILQNMDVFFVDTPRDMCEFTKAGVVDGDYGPYLQAHPTTAALLDEMAKPVASVLASPYWSALPFAFGENRFVKYKLEPDLEVDPPATAPADPSYLASDLARRLAEGPARFRFCIQFRTNPESMPLDRATVRWLESESPFVYVADVELPRQDVTARGQPDYGENLAWNIWRVTAEHTPQGSIAEARRAVYAASAAQRRNVNGVPDGEPVNPKPELSPAVCADDRIVRAAIHPGIGIARVGDAEHECYIGPEVTQPAPASPGFYRDSSGALKRQAARFRIYGYNAGGTVVRELTADNADIRWTVHLANRKAEWFRFITAMDIPETASLSVPRRNAAIKGADRNTLVINPGPRSIAGSSVSGGAERFFDSGEFKGEKVYLGELRTDEAARLLVLGGRGVSHSPSGAPPFDPSDPDTFNNADDWYDDVADGPVTATVSIAGQPVPVESAWVVVAPPNYAPDAIGWRTLYDLLVDLYTKSGWLAMPSTTSFSRDVLPLLARLSNLQWVNQGFSALFGKGGPMDFDDPAFLARLAAGPDAITRADPYRELRQRILGAFRPHDPEVNEPRLWPWIYGDDFGGSLFSASPRTMLALPTVQQVHLQRWAAGSFTADWDPAAVTPKTLSEVPLAEQPAMLDQAALHFCLADAFHPGCEMTWPMRHASMYAGPFRIRHRTPDELEPSYPDKLDQESALALAGPLYAQGPGDITKWMGLPWQGDTAFCRSGYDVDYDRYLPTFWPARVPNQVLTEEDYRVVIDTGRRREERVAAFQRRAVWDRTIHDGVSTAGAMMRMVEHFGVLGLIEARPGVPDDPDFPSIIYVETLAAQRVRALLAAAALVAAAPAAPPGSHEERVQQSGWVNAAYLEAARRMRMRQR